MYYLHYSCVVVVVVFFFKQVSRKKKKSQLSRIIRVIQNHNPETEKDQKNISNFGLSSQELNRAVSSFSTFHLLLLLLLLLLPQAFTFRDVTQPKKVNISGQTENVNKSPICHGKFIFTFFIPKPKTFL